jgi:hypothetical protein
LKKQQKSTLLEGQLVIYPDQTEEEHRELDDPHIA